jgi:hypothetical protein
MPSKRKRPNKHPNKEPSLIPSSVRGNVVGITQAGGALSVAGIVRDIMEDRSCRRLGTAVGTSKFQRTMVTERMLIDAARQLARQASDNPLDFRYGLCVFGLMPAQSAPGEVWAQFVRMCKAFSVAQHVLDAGSTSYPIARINNIQATAAYRMARELYGHVRATNPLVTMTGVQEGLLEITETLNPRKQSMVSRLLLTEHRIEFLRHMFYLRIALRIESVEPLGLLTWEDLSDALELTASTCVTFFSGHLRESDDTGRRALILAILRRVPQLYSTLWNIVENSSTWDGGFQFRALKTVFDAYSRPAFSRDELSKQNVKELQGLCKQFSLSTAGKKSEIIRRLVTYSGPVDIDRFSRRYAHCVRVAERCNDAFMRYPMAIAFIDGPGNVQTDYMLATTWSDHAQDSYMDHTLKLQQSQVVSLLQIFPRALVCLHEGHLGLWEDEDDGNNEMLRNVLEQNPRLKQYVINDTIRRSLGLAAP